MNNLYSNDFIKKYKKQIKNAIIKILLPLIIVIPLYVIFLVIAEEDTENLYIFLSTVIWCLFGFILVFNLIENILRPKDLIKHIDNILNASESTFTGKVKTISKEMTLKKNIHIKEIEIVKEYETHRSYFVVDFNTCNIKVNDNISVFLVNNFIKAYEVVNND